MLSGCHMMLSGCHMMLSGCHMMLSGCHMMLSDCHMMLSGCHMMLSGCHMMLSGCHMMLSDLYTLSHDVSNSILQHITKLQTFHGSYCQIKTCWICNYSLESLLNINICILETVYCASAVSELHDPVNSV